MRNAWPFLLLLVACASTAVYERGTARPAPAPVRPGVGAPTVGQPGMRPDAIPRGPYTRVLPPTREPGVWAVDPPKASGASGPVVIDGISLPIPEADRSNERVMACASAVRAAISENKGLKNLQRALLDMKTCGVFLAWRHCMFSPLWPSREAPTASRIVGVVDDLMMRDNTSSKCWKWQDAFKPDLDGTFDWYLHGWYYRIARPRQ